MKQETKECIKEAIRIALMIAELTALIMAAYIAYQMYNYADGYEAARQFYNTMHPSQPCYLINQTLNLTNRT